MHDAVRCRVVVVPSGPVSAVWTAALRDLADAAQLGAVAGGKGRHHTVVSCRRLVRVDGTQAPKAASRQRRAPSRTCRGVSASSLHSRHSAAGHCMELHCVQSGVGRRPTLCRYCSEPLQCLLGAPVCLLDRGRTPVPPDGTKPAVRPALLPGGGGGAHDGPLDDPDVDRGFKLGRALASRARASFRSLPDSPRWAGTQCLKIGCPLSASGLSRFQNMSAATGVLWTVLQQGQRRRRIGADDDRVGGGLVLSARQFLQRRS